MKQATVKCVVDPACPGDCDGHYNNITDGKTYSDHPLKCKPVSCKIPWLPPAANGVLGLGCKHLPGGCPSNVNIPADCSNKTFDEGHNKCKVDCHTGFTRVTRNTEHADESTLTYTCVQDGPAKGDSAKAKGIWQPGAVKSGPHSLECEAVSCEAARTLPASTPGELPREEHTFDPLIDEIQLYSAEDRQHLDLRQLGAEPDKPSKCTAHYLGFGDTPGGDTPAANGTCSTECLPSWYPYNRGSRQRTFTCDPPPSSGPTGVWTLPGTRSALNCTPGSLSVSNTKFDLAGGAASLAVLGDHAKQWPFLLGDDSNPYPGGARCQGWAFAKSTGGCFDGFEFAKQGDGSLGPTVNFYLHAMDQHNLHRNYQTLPHIERKGGVTADYLLAVIERVPLERLNGTNNFLQPKKIDDGSCCVTEGETRNCGQGSDCPLRSYVATNPSKSHPDSEGAPDLVTNPGRRGGGTSKYVPIPLPGAQPGAVRQKPFVSEGADGLWQIKHQFTEHGIFYISIYLCENQEIGIPPGCDYSKDLTDSLNLVPGTGFSRKDGTKIGDKELPLTAFTVCPQNTEPKEAYAENGMIPGAHLDECRARVGYYSPKGPGYISEKCQEGFSCTHAGQRWPVAQPNYWVDPKEPSKMSKCGLLGACPGSSIFVDAAKSCPSVNSSADGKKMEFNSSKLDFDLKTTVLSYGCFMYPAPTGIAESSRKLHKPFLEPHCYEEAGSRCCLGYTGKKCADCCKKSTHGSRFPSCDGEQWHSIGSGEGQHCEQCPKGKTSKLLVFLMLLLCLIFLPVFVKLSDVMRHAGAATGPILSVVNFVQSADLFQALDLHWPKFFKKLCREIANLFNSLNLWTKIMDLLNSLVPIDWGIIPTPQCELQLTFVQKWCLIMLTPIMLIFLYYGVTLIYILIWRSLGLELLWAKVKLYLGRIWQWSCEQCGREPAFGSEMQELLIDQTGHGMGLKSREPEPEPERMGSVILSKKDQETAAAAAPKDGHGWQFRAWKDGRGYWHDFSEADQANLDEAMNDGVHKTSLQRGEFEYEIDLKKLVQKNKSTGRTRNIRAPARSFFYRYRFARSFMEHSWESTLSGCIRLVLLYLLVGYTFLSGTALEPIACQQDLDLSNWVEAAPSIECNWCPAKFDPHSGSDTNSSNAPKIDEMDPAILDEKIQLTYPELASLSIAAFTLYGFGTPVLFGVILWSHREDLQSNTFVKRFGFLVTKMKTEYFWWEILISFRKLFLVVATKFADGQRLPCSLVNLFITVAAFGFQVYTLPFANDDANIAEALTLLATVLILVLGLAQKAKSAEELIGGISEDEDALVGTFLGNLNLVIYILMGGMVGASVLIVCRRLRGALFNAQHLSQLDNAENDGRQIPDEVRKMLHKRWLLVASSWAAIQAKEAQEDSQLEENDVVRLTSGLMAHVKEVNPDGCRDKYVVELQTQVTNEDVEDEHFAFDNQMNQIQDTIRKTRKTEIKERRTVVRENLVKEGDIERMTRVFTKFGKQQKSELVTQWKGLFPHWDDFFPEKDRRSMYILGANADIDDLEDLVWVMEQLINMEAQQHSFCPKCCQKGCQRVHGAVSEVQVILPRGFVEGLREAFDGGQDRAEPGQTIEGGQSDEPELQSLTANPARFRKSVAQRESDLRTTLVQLQAQQKRHRPSVSCCACQNVAQALWGSQQRAVATVVVSLLSVFVTVLCVTHMLVSKYAGTGDASKTLCQPDAGHLLGLISVERGYYAWHLIIYWVFTLVVLPLGLLYRRVRKVQAEAQRAKSSAVIPTSNLFQPEPEPEPEPAPKLEVFARSHTASLDSAADQSDDDNYSSGGEDDPNWRAKRELDLRLASSATWRHTSEENLAGSMFASRPASPGFDSAQRPAKHKVYIEGKSLARKLEISLPLGPTATTIYGLKMMILKKIHDDPPPLDQMDLRLPNEPVLAEIAYLAASGVADGATLILSFRIKGGGGDGNTQSPREDPATSPKIKARFAAFAPPHVAPGNGFILTVHVYVPTCDSDIIRQQLHEGREMVSSRKVRLQEDDLVEIRLTLPPEAFTAEFDGVDSFEWDGESDMAQFTLKCLPGAVAQAYQCLATVCIRGQVVNKLMFELSVIERSHPGTPPSELIGRLTVDGLTQPSHDFMISYTQQNPAAETLAEAIYGELIRLGKSVWFDVKMPKRNEAAMEDAVKNAQCVLAIVSESAPGKSADTAYFRREFCKKELRWAKDAGVFVQPVVAVEDRRKITAFFEGIPSDLQHLTAVDWQHVDRKDDEFFRLSVDKIIRAAREGSGTFEQRVEPKPVAALFRGMNSSSNATSEVDDSVDATMLSSRVNSLFQPEPQPDPEPATTAIQSVCEAESRPASDDE
eukprot:COSAG02_NODE_634_length_19259_cov_9.871347_8_plen_2349_part_00